MKVDVVPAHGSREHEQADPDALVPVAMQIKKSRIEKMFSSI